MWRDTLHFIPQLLPATGKTIVYTCTTMAIALVAGLLVALARRSGRWYVTLPFSIYVEVIRGTPLLLQIFYIFYVLPNVGIRLSAPVAGITALSLNYAAYLSEVYRSGLDAVDPGQGEAAAALGMRRRTAMQTVILPQAVRIVIPPLGNYFVALFKDTALLSTIAVLELMFSAQVTAAQTFNYLPIYTAALILYFVISYPAALGVRYLERRLTPKSR